MRSSTVVAWYPQKFEGKTHQQCVSWLHRSLALLTANAKRTKQHGGRCPIQFGRLAGSITWEVDEKNLTGRYGSNVDYAVHQELGTSKISANHFLEGALQDLKGELNKLW